MRPAFYDKVGYKNKQSAITKGYWEHGLFNFKIKPLITRTCANPNCKSPFQIKPFDPKLFCSRNCSATTNNLKRKRNIKSNCLVCNTLTKRRGGKFCSNKCQHTYGYNEYITRWKQDLESVVLEG